LKPVVKDRRAFDKTNDYPRKWLSDYDERNPKYDAIAVETEWQLDEDDVAAVEAIVGPDALELRTISAEKGYGGGPHFGLKLKHQQIIPWPGKESGCVKADLDAPKKVTTPAQLAEFLTNYDGDPSPGIANLKAKLAKFPNSNYNQAVINTLFSRMPSFLYFSNYDRMSGRVSIDDLNIRQQNSKPLTEGQRLFLEFFSICQHYDGRNRGHQESRRPQGEDPKRHRSRFRSRSSSIGPKIET
jgi:hypothetical protein